VASTASGSTGTLTTQFRQNRILDIPKAGYSLEKRGTPAIQLGGTASNATAEITSTNDGGAVLVVGQVNIVDSANLPSPPASIGNYVWLDNDGNGIQDGTETGARFVELRITGTDEDARPIDRRTLSDANGEYFFSALIPGEYTLTVNLPRATALVTKLQGDDRQFDSNFDQTTRQFAVQLTTDDLSIDAGLWSTYTNPRNPLDVNDDTFISPIDALLIINDLNTGQSRALVLPPPPQGTPPFIDTSADNFIAPIDVLLVINAINASSQAEGELGEGELAEEEMMADFARFAQIWYAEMEAQISEKVARRLQLL